MADRALGLAAAAHAELADHACPASPTRARPRRLHDDARGRSSSSTTTPPAIDAPVQTGTTVTRVGGRPTTATTVATDRGAWRCATVVLASGACNVAAVPALAGGAAAVGRPASRR